MDSRLGANQKQNAWGFQSAAADSGGQGGLARSLCETHLPDPLAAYIQIPREIDLNEKLSSI